MIPTTAITRFDLSMLEVEFNLRASRAGFIGHRIFPFVGKDKPEGEWGKVPLESLLHRHKTTRGPRGQYSRSNTKWETTTYATQEHGLEARLDDRTVKRYNDIIDAEFYETERIIDGILREHEIAAAADAFDTSFFGTAAVGTAWSNLTGSDPNADIRANRETIVTAIGYEPNTLVVNTQVMRLLKNNASLIDRLKYQGYQDARPDNITAQDLAASLDIDQVLVAGAIYNDAQNGAVAKNISRIWPSTQALLCRVCEDPMNPYDVCVGKTPMWTEEGEMDGDRLGVIVEEYREESIRGSVMRARTDYQRKRDYPGAGLVLTGVNP